VVWINPRCPAEIRKAAFFTLHRVASTLPTGVFHSSKRKEQRWGDAFFRGLALVPQFPLFFVPFVTFCKNSSLLSLSPLARLRVIAKDRFIAPDVSVRQNTRRRRRHRVTHLPGGGFGFRQPIPSLNCRNHSARPPLPLDHKPTAHPRRTCIHSDPVSAAESFSNLCRPSAEEFSCHPNC